MNLITISAARRLANRIGIKTVQTRRSMLQKPNDLGGVQTLDESLRLYSVAMLTIVIIHVK